MQKNAKSPRHTSRAGSERSPRFPNGSGSLQCAPDSEAKTAEGEKARIRLLEIRGILARIGEAVGLDPKLFSLRTDDSRRLSAVLMNMTNVLRAAEANLRRMPDTKRVQALIAEADALIASNKVFAVEDQEVQSAKPRLGRCSEASRA